MDYKQRNAILDAVPRTFFSPGAPRFSATYQNRADRRKIAHGIHDHTASNRAPSLVPATFTRHIESSHARKRRENLERAVSLD